MQELVNIGAGWGPYPVYGWVRLGDSARNFTPDSLQAIMFSYTMESLCNAQLIGGLDTIILQDPLAVIDFRPAAGRTLCRDVLVHT